MLVTIGEFNGLGRDANRREMPLAALRIVGQKLTAAGSSAALASATSIIRVATDTAIHIKTTGAGAADTDDMMPANTVEFFQVTGGVIVSIIAA